MLQYLVNVTSDHPFPIEEIDNIYIPKATSTCITQDSINNHSTEMINQSENRRISFDSCSIIVEVSRFIMVHDYIICILMSQGSQKDPINYNLALAEEQDRNHEVQSGSQCINLWIIGISNNYQ